MLPIGWFTFGWDVCWLYTDDVLTEQAILKWYHDAHLAKGKSVFLPQMRRMVEWLNTADEESDKG